MTAADPILRGPVLAGLPRRLEPPRGMAGVRAVGGSAGASDLREQAGTEPPAGMAAPTDPGRRESASAVHGPGYAEGHAQGHAEGYAAGHAQGLAEARAAAAAAAEQAHEVQRDAVARLEKAAADAERRAESGRSHARETDRRARESALQAARQAWHERLAALERAAGAAAWTALCRLLGEHTSRRELLEGLVSQTLREAAAALPTRVRVNAADLARLNSEDAIPDGALEWVADPALSPGSCEVDAARGTWTADLDAQLHALRELWRGHVA